MSLILLVEFSRLTVFQNGTHYECELYKAKTCIKKEEAIFIKKGFIEPFERLSDCI